MKAALIPPKGYNNTVYRSGIHLALAQVGDEDYRRTYLNIPRGDYLILDNGAAEGEPVKDSELIDAAKYYGADEVVLPDVMCKGYDTLRRIRIFLELYGHLAEQVKFMAVVQGSSFTEVRNCIDTLIRDKRISVLGIPRHLISTLDSKGARARVLEYIQRFYGTERKEVHLLGTSPHHPTEIQFISKTYPWVRSVDSSLPYNYAIAGRRLADVGTEPVRRPEGYFTEEREVDHELLMDNITTYLEWAYGTEGARS